MSLICPKCGSKAIYSWCGQPVKVRYHLETDDWGATRSVPEPNEIKDVGASIECGGCKYKIQGRPGQTLQDITPQWKAEGRPGPHRNRGRPAK